jgi:protein-tyrosine phosphatase
MGISRSASTVVAFAMKYFQWNMSKSSLMKNCPWNVK